MPEISLRVSSAPFAPEGLTDFFDLMLTFCQFIGDGASEPSRSLGTPTENNPIGDVGFLCRI